MPQPAQDEVAGGNINIKFVLKLSKKRQDEEKGKVWAWQQTCALLAAGTPDAKGYPE